MLDPTIYFGELNDKDEGVIDLTVACESFDKLKETHEVAEKKEFTPYRSKVFYLSSLDIFSLNNSKD